MGDPMKMINLDCAATIVTDHALRPYRSLAFRAVDNLARIRNVDSHQENFYLLVTNFGFKLFFVTSKQCFPTR